MKTLISAKEILVDYNYYESSVKKQNDILVSIGIPIIVLLSALIGVLVFKYNNYVFRASEVFNREGLSKDICIEGLRTIFDHKAHESLVSKKLVNYLKKHNYEDFDFEINEKNQFRYVEMISKDACKVIIQNEEVDGHGLISLLISIKESEDFPFQYKVSDYREFAIRASEVTLAKEN